MNQLPEESIDQSKPVYDVWMSLTKSNGTAFTYSKEVANVLLSTKEVYKSSKFRTNLSETEWSVLLGGGVIWR